MMDNQTELTSRLQQPQACWNPRALPPLCSDSQLYNLQILPSVVHLPFQLPLWYHLHAPVLSGGPPGSSVATVGLLMHLLSFVLGNDPDASWFSRKYARTILHLNEQYYATGQIFTFLSIL